MKGVILAGGNGSRLKPVTHVLNKNLLPVYDKPAIFYSIELLKRAGIMDMCIIAEYKYIEDFKTMLGNGYDFDVNLHYESDTHLRKGPAAAVPFARNFIGDDNFVLIFADGIYDVDIREDVDNFESGSLIFVKKVDNPKRYGIIEFDTEGKVLSFEEKPEYPKSDYAFTGLSIYDHKALHYLDVIRPGLDGEYYMTDVSKIYMEIGELKAKILDGFWQDMGTFDGLLRASNYWSEKGKQFKHIP
jgi:glucose-1-phosphate thymidylyltransferase